MKFNYKKSDLNKEQAKEREQKRKKVQKEHNRTKFSIPSTKWSKLGFKNYFIGVVVEVHKKNAFVSMISSDGVIDTKNVWLATVANCHLQNERIERNFIVVGDKVLCVPNESKERYKKHELPYCVIHHQAPRESKLERIDPRNKHLKHVLASNFNQLFIIASILKPRVRWRLIDRYLVLAAIENIDAIIVLTKKDILSKENEETIAEFTAHINNYKKIGYDVFVIDSLDPKLSDQTEFKNLTKKVTGRISLLSGQSGVGKSTCVNLFDPEIIQIVEKNSDIFYKGRHTTTYASLIKLGVGGMFIDTPGIKSFAFSDVDSSDLDKYYIEMLPYIGKCQYRGCKHQGEPNCEIVNACSRGEITKYRYESYIALLTGDTGRSGKF